MLDALMPSNAAATARADAERGIHRKRIENKDYKGACSYGHVPFSGECAPAVRGGAFRFGARENEGKDLRCPCFCGTIGAEKR